MRRQVWIRGHVRRVRLLNFSILFPTHHKQTNSKMANTTLPVVILDQYYYSLSALITVGFQLACFLIAATFKFDLITDFAGSMNFVLLSVLTLVLGNNFGSRGIAILVLVLITRLYLAFFLLFRVCTRKKDARFDEVRDNCLKFFGKYIRCQGQHSPLLVRQQRQRPLTPPNLPFSHSFLGLPNVLGLPLHDARVVHQQSWAIGTQHTPSSLGHRRMECLWDWHYHPNHCRLSKVWVQTKPRQQRQIHEYRGVGVQSPRTCVGNVGLFSFLSDQMLIFFFSLSPPLFSSSLVFQFLPHSPIISVKFSFGGVPSFVWFPPSLWRPVRPVKLLLGLPPFFHHCSPCSSCCWAVVFQLAKGKT